MPRVEAGRVAQDLEAIQRELGTVDDVSKMVAKELRRIGSIIPDEHLEEDRRPDWLGTTGDFCQQSCACNTIRKLCIKTLWHEPYDPELLRTDPSQGREPVGFQIHRPQDLAHMRHAVTIPDKPDANPALKRRKIHTKQSLDYTKRLYLLE